MRKPNFLIVGAPKSGTTAIYEMLRQHPDIFMPGLKEPHFFSQERTDSEWLEYLSLFENTNAKMIGEASTSYLSAPGAAERIYRYLGPIKIIVMLRDPVDQMWSMYQHNVRNNVEDSVSFEVALQREAQRQSRGENAALLYRKRAQYYEQVRAYIDIMGRENVFIGLFEEFRCDQLAVVRSIFEFLEVDSSFVPRVKWVNFHGEPRIVWLHRMLTTQNKWTAITRFLPVSTRRYLRRRLRDLNLKPSVYPKVPDHIRAELVAEMVDEVTMLSDLLGKDLILYWENFRNIQRNHEP